MRYLGQLFLLATEILMPAIVILGFADMQTAAAAA